MTWLAEYSLRVAALIAVVGAGSILSRSASAHGRLFAWTVVLYIAAAMPLLADLLPALPIPVLYNAPLIVVSSGDSGLIEPAFQAAALPGISPSSSALSWLFTAYLVGVVFLF